MNIDRGMVGRTPRPRSLDLESQQDFVRGFRRWVYGDMDEAAKRRCEAVLEASGVDPGPGSDFEAVREILHADPVVATRNRCWHSSQTLMRRDLLNHFHAEADFYRGVVDAPLGEAANDGGLELDPDFVVPDYARHEIHIQPGGYVGDVFAGLLYHQTTNSFYSTLGGNESDQQQERLAARAVAPEDDRVERIVDLGCGIGQLSMGLKTRFPGAEVIGVDVAEPMLRYGRSRSAAFGHPVRFIQGLAEDTGLEAGSADMVCAYLLFHEIPGEIAVKVVAEAYRLLRPGCVFNVFDFRNGEAKGAYDRYTRWVDYKFNNELWSLEYLALDFRGVLRAAGFDVESDPGGRGLTHFVARKPLA